MNAYGGRPLLLLVFGLTAAASVVVLPALERSEPETLILRPIFRFETRSIRNFASHFPSRPASTALSRKRTSPVTPTDALTAPLRFRFLPESEADQASPVAFEQPPEQKSPRSSRATLPSFLVLFLLGIFTGGCGWLIQQEVQAMANRWIHDPEPTSEPEFGFVSSAAQVIPASYAIPNNFSSGQFDHEEPPALLPTSTATPLLERLMEDPPLAGQSVSASSN